MPSKKQVRFFINHILYILERLLLNIIFSTLKLLGCAPQPQCNYNKNHPRRPEPLCRPLPSLRPRRLTDSSTSHPQAQSLLLSRLPAELRLQIWTYALGREHDGDVLHLDLAYGSLRYTRCRQPHDHDQLGFEHECWTEDWRRELRGDGEKVADSRRTLKPLVLTCRTIYTESIALLYATNTFSFRRCPALLRLPRILLPERLQQIRRLEFSTAFQCGFYCYSPLPADQMSKDWVVPDDVALWPGVCKVLAGMQRLEFLRVEIAVACGRGRHERDRDGGWGLRVVETLGGVRAREFVVVVRGLEPGVRERLGETAYRLVESGRVERAL